MQAADFIVESLIANGFDVVYGVPGGSVEAVQDALYRARDRIRFVLSRHESAACFQAAAHWCFSGRAAAVLTTSGAGLFNAYNGLYEAYASRVPLLLVSGAIPRHAEGHTLFQNLSGKLGSPDAESSLRPTTVWCQTVDHGGDIPGTLDRAYHTMRAPRRGPAVLIVPRDVQLMEVSATPRAVATPPIREGGDLAHVLAELRRAERPLVVVGEGVKRHRAEAELATFLRASLAPAVTTPAGKDCVPADLPHHLGPVGLFGVRRPALATTAADLLLFVGATADAFSAVQCDLASTRHASILEGDGDWSSPPIYYAGDLRGALAVATSAMSGAPERKPWWPSAPMENRSPLLCAGGPALNTNSAIRRIAGGLRPGDQVIYDCGLVAAAMIHFATLPDGVSQELTLASATMGYAVAGAIGAAIAAPGRRTIGITGDGSLLMYGAELNTAATEDLDILFIVMNNGGHGIGVKAQEAFYHGRVYGTRFTPVDGIAYARALGVRAVFRVGRLEDLDAALEEALAARGPRLLEVMIAEEAFPPMLNILRHASGAGPDEVFG